MSAAWTAVIPVKILASAKSRLACTDETRAEFARAVALDTLDIVAGSARVGRILVVTAETELVDPGVRRPPVVILREPESESGDALNGAIRVGQEWAISHARTSPIVVVPADLAALTAPAFDGALHQLAWLDRTHIPDHWGRGTTLSAAARPELLVPRYGIGSERAHAAAGSVPILDVELGVRLDVDSLDDLAGAASLGLGPRTRRIRLVDASVGPLAPLTD